MDLFNIRAIEVSGLAMDGLLERQTAIASNTANAMTPDYQRKRVAFEDQLQNIIEKDNIRRDLRMQNSLAYAKDKNYKVGYDNPMMHNFAQKLPQEQMMYIRQTDVDMKFYDPEVIKDTRMIDYGNGNNVNVEEEMMDMAKTGQKYSALATLQSRFHTNIMDVIKGN